MANTKITSKVIADANILTAAIADNAVTGDKVADDVALAGNPTTTTQTAGNSTTRLATTAFVSTAISNLVDSSPSALNTLNELAAALGDDANFSTTVTNSIATKVALSGSGQTIADSGDLTLDVGGDIILDADGGDIKFKDGGTEFSRIAKGSSDDVFISAIVQDKDIQFRGNDGGSTITALTLDMSAAGKALFNSGANFSGNIGFGLTSPTFASGNGMHFADGFAAGFGTGNGTRPDFQITGDNGGLQFICGTGSDTADVLMTTAGNVGIGEPSPSTSLHVSKGTNGSGLIDVARFENQGTTVNDGARIQLTAGASTSGAGIGCLGDSLNSAHLVLHSGGNNERVRLSSNGTLSVNSTTTAWIDSNDKFITDGRGVFRGYGHSALAIGRYNSGASNGEEGSLLDFLYGGSGVGSIDILSSNIVVKSIANLHFEQNGNSVTRSINFTGTSFKPFDSNDNTMSMGTSGARWTQLFAATSTIGTSDRNEKQNEAAISAAEKRVAIAAKGLLKKFKFKDAVTEKGSDARIHFGIIAQDLQDAFSAEGLDASDYAMWCSDTWTDEDTGQSKTRLGIRYEELLAFIIAGM